MEATSNAADLLGLSHAEESLKALVAMGILIQKVWEGPGVLPA